MEQAHRQLIGFQLLALPEHGEAFVDELPAPSDRSRSARYASHDAHEGLGQIPRLPRPKFLSALAAFALGE